MFVYKKISLEILITPDKKCPICRNLRCVEQEAWYRVRGVASRGHAHVYRQGPSPRQRIVRYGIFETRRHFYK